MTELEKEVKKVKLFIVFLYLTKIMTYGAISLLVALGSIPIAGVFTFLVLYLGAGHIERQIYGYKRALSMVKMLEGIKKELDKK